MNERTTSEIERDIAKTRAEMGHTIDAIQERLSPGQLVDQALHYFQSGGGRTVTDGASQFAQNLGRAIRDNPVPVALVATGLAWLMVARGRRPSYSYAYDEYEEYEELLDDEAQIERYGTTEELAARYEQRMGRSETSAERDADPTFAGHYGSTARAPGATGVGPSPQAGGMPPRPGVGGTVGAATMSDRAEEGRKI